MSDPLPREVLCIGFEPSGLGVGTHPVVGGVPLKFTAATDRETTRQFLHKPRRWDLLLVHSPAFYDLGVDEFLKRARNKLHASVLMVRAPASELSAAEAIRRGAADIVHHGDREHLEAVMVRELTVAAMRRELGELRDRGGARGGFALPHVRDYGQIIPAGPTPPPDANTRLSIDDIVAAGIPSLEALEDERIKGLIERGGLTLEYQAIVPLLPDASKRTAMFEALLRLRDDDGRLLSPGQFFPAAVRHQWLERLDLWVFRRALPVLERTQAEGSHIARLFLNLSTETVSRIDSVREIIEAINSTPIRAGTLTVEVRRDAITGDQTPLALLQQALSARGHSLLLDHVGLGDMQLLREHGGWFRYLKLEPELIYGVSIGRRNTDALVELISLAAGHDIRVIALAVDSAKSLPALYQLGIDYIQGHFVSRPYEDLVYPDVFSVDSKPDAKPSR